MSLHSVQDSSVWCNLRFRCWQASIHTGTTLTLFRWPGLKLKGASFKFSMVKSSNASGVSHPSESRVDAYRLTSGCAAGRPRAAERCEVNAEIVVKRALSSSRAAAPDSFSSSSCCSRRSGLLDPHPILRKMKVAQACLYEKSSNLVVSPTFARSRTRRMNF